MRRPALIPILAINAVLLMASCSTAPSEPVRGGGGDELLGRGVPNLFISPAGKPYREAQDQPYPSAQWFAAADTDHDGKLTREEFRADAAAFFKVLDANNDGVIDGFEVQHYERDIAPEINPQLGGLRFGEGMDLSLGRADGRGPSVKGPKSGREEAGDRRPEGAGLYGLLNEPEPVAAADVKFDGRITLQEFLAAADRRFTALDKQNQGYLTLGGLPKTPVQRLLERISAKRTKQERN